LRAPPARPARAEGRTLGQSLRRFHAVVVAGSDPDATAEVALGIAEAQSAERRVILGDLSNSPRFIVDDDPHGLVDAFDYGISLGRVARSVAGNGNLHVVPTGNLAPDFAELLAHPRWSRLFTAFTDSDQLLVLAVPLSAQGVDDVVHQLDGLILVDGLAPARVDAAKIIANVVLPPIPLPRLSQVTPSEPQPLTPRPKALPRSPQPGTRSPKPASRGPQPDARNPQPAARRQTTVLQAFAKPAGYGAGLSILGVLIAFWLFNQPFGDNEPRSGIPGPLPRVLGSQQPAPPPKPPDPNEVNPADSGAAVYAVRMVSVNTQPGAILKLDEYGTSMPATTFAPVEKSARLWFEVLSGAYTTRGGADSLLTSLRAAGRLDSISGVVVRVPYAVLLDSVRKSATIPDLIASLRTRSLPVYALEQRTGWVWVVAGAFETRSQADTYAETIRARGQTADVVLRQGRMF
jgi:hypothetical protein